MNPPTQQDYQAALDAMKDCFEYMGGPVIATEPYSAKWINDHEETIRTALTECAKGCGDVPKLDERPIEHQIEDELRRIGGIVGFDMIQNVINILWPRECFRIDIDNCRKEFEQYDYASVQKRGKNYRDFMQGWVSGQRNLLNKIQPPPNNHNREGA